MTTARPYPAPPPPNPHGFLPSVSKQQIMHLPLRRHEGPVHVISQPSQVGPALRALRGERFLGFDTESRPAFRKGESYLPSLLQLASSEGVHLFQLNRLKLTPGLVALLSDPKVLKVGVGLDHEAVTLRKMAEFEPAGFVELGPLADKMGVEANGLRGLAACVLGFRISKRAQLSNWGRKALTEEQIHYAATDAWVSREIYRCLTEGNGQSGS